MNMIYIIDAVGRMFAKNRPEDVITIQNSLNTLEPKDGRPVPMLDVDGVCGSKTIKAIQLFQLQHFGWSGADGRVDPNGQSIQKLNQLNYPYPIPPGTMPLTTKSILYCPHGGIVRAVPNHLSNRPVSQGFPILYAYDNFYIEGCVHYSANKPSPCVKVIWQGNQTSAINDKSVGICVNAMGVPQGQARLIKR